MFNKKSDDIFADNFFNYQKINILFIQSNGKKDIIIVSQKMTLEDLLDSYRIKIGKNLNFLKNNIFLFNGKKINIKENIKIIDYGLINGSYIFVTKIKEVKCEPKIIIKIFENEYLVYSDYMETLLLQLI